jgi:hypothetical protein
MYSFMHNMSRLMFWFFTVTIVGVLVLLGTPNNLHAQSVPRFTAVDISLDVEPQNPDAFQEVTLTLKTFAIDLDIHNITWLVNGDEFTSGIGKKSITLKTGAYGQATNIQARINGQDGSIVLKNITLRPATVDVLWEAVDSYVPPFYQGKALPSRGAVIKVTAIPNLIIGDEYLTHSNLDYTWSWNFNIKGSSSGFNKQFMAIKNSVINRQETVSVDVKNTSATVRGSGTTKISFFAPEILWYKNFSRSPQYDMRRAVSGNLSIGQNNAELVAVPYFFSVAPGKTLDSLLYQWRANDTIIAEDKTVNKNQLSLRPAGAGRTTLDLEVRHPVEGSQSTSASINIISN